MFLRGMQDAKDNDGFTFKAEENLVGEPVEQHAPEAFIIYGKMKWRFFEAHHGFGHRKDKLVAQTGPLLLVPIVRILQVGVRCLSCGNAPRHDGLEARMRRRVSRQGVPGLPSRWKSASA